MSIKALNLTPDSHMFTRYHMISPKCSCLQRILHNKMNSVTSFTALKRKLKFEFHYKIKFPTFIHSYGCIYPQI
jgi:hypothetical protein